MTLHPSTLGIIMYLLEGGKMSKTAATERLDGNQPVKVVSHPRSQDT